MGLYLKGNGIAVTDIDDPGILSRALNNLRSLSWQTPQVNLGAFLTAVLAPHHAEDPEFREIRLAS